MRIDWEMMSFMAKRNMKRSLVKHPIMRNPIFKLKDFECEEASCIISCLTSTNKIAYYDAIECMQEARLLFTLARLSYKKRNYKDAARQFDLALFALEKTGMDFSLSTWLETDNLLYPETFEI